jgi:phosphoglucomutase
MKEIGRRLTGYFSVTSSLKKARISKINYLDGLCLYLSNDEIIHLRPSGNAAQFRVYAEAASLSRASEIVNESICPNTGMVVRIINDYLAGEQDPASLESNSGICVAKSL